MVSIITVREKHTRGEILLNGFCKFYVIIIINQQCS